MVTVRELRLVLGLLLLLFVTAETWRYVGRLAVLRVVLFTLMTVTASVLVVGIGFRQTVERSAVKPATIRVAVELIAFGALLFVTFAVVGILSVDADLVQEWSGSPDGVLVSFTVSHPPFVVTRQLLQVSAFLAALGALAFGVEVIADAATRDTLVRDLVAPSDQNVGSRS